MTNDNDLGYYTIEEPIDEISVRNTFQDIVIKVASNLEIKYNKKDNK
jgi:hypothetical protein